jgi:glycosyltransferase involved in cell wall biosynthesis
VQHSAHLAGAQKSLSRLLLAPEIQDFSPVLLTAEEGWLTSYCSRHSVPWLRMDFPSPRSIKARLLGSCSRFAQKAAAALKPLLSTRELIVHANDHPDSLVGLSLAQALGAKTILTLRTPNMSRRDFIKHGGLRQNHLISVGEELEQSALAWVNHGEVTLIHNGVTSEEILPPAPAPLANPDCLIVLGSMSPRKGWQELVTALLLIESQLKSVKLPEVHFLGDLLGQNPNLSLGLNRLKYFRTRFLGVQENYRECLRRYPLAIHPSRSESFGMAALECVAAGVPLVAAATGRIPQFIPNKSFLFAPENACMLAERLFPLLNQPDLAYCAAKFNISLAQSLVQERFSTTSTAKKLKQVYNSLPTNFI